MISRQKIMDFGKLSEYLDDLYLHPQLRNLFFELTDKCNLHCTHCGSNSSAENSSFLKYGQVVKALTDVAKAYDPAGIRICITGGEPVIHPDAVKIVRAAHDMGFSVGMTSNGTLIDDAAAKSLSEAGLGSAAVSIDGLPSDHEAFRCAPGCFGKAMEGLKNLQKYGVYTQATTVVHKKNLKDLEKIYLMLKGEGVTSWAIVNMDPIGRAKGREDLLLSKDELFEMYSFIREKRFDVSNDMEVTSACSHYQGMDFEHETRDFYFQCWSGLKIASITAEGDIVGCLDMERRPEFVQGNIDHDSFTDVWENRFEVFRKNRALTCKLCSTCEYKNECRGDSYHTWNHDLNEPDYCIKKLSAEENTSGSTCNG